MNIFVIEREDRARTIEKLSKFLAATLPGKRIKVTVERFVETRSIQQSRALWGHAYARLQQETGNDKDDLHLMFCLGFFGETTRTVMGRTITVPKRTTTTNEKGERDVLSRVDFGAFFDYVQQRSAEMGYYIEDPDPMWRVRLAEEQRKEAAKLRGVAA